MENLYIIHLFLILFHYVESTIAAEQTLPPGGMPMPGMPGMLPPMLGAGCAAYTRSPALCKQNFPMCQWVFDEDMWTCMESNEVESSKDFWTMQNMPGAVTMNPAQAAMIGASEGDMPPFPMPPMTGGGMPSAPAGGMPSAPAVNPSASSMMPPMMPLSCEMVRSASQCGAMPLCTWTLDDNMMVCMETKEVESNKAFWIGQQGQMFPNGPPNLMPGAAGGMPSPAAPAPSSPVMPAAGGIPPMPAQSCEMLLTAESCRAMMPHCQWVLDEALWACMEAKEVESNKGFWTFHNMNQGQMPGMPVAPSTGGTTETTAAATANTASTTAAAATATPAFLQRTHSESEPSNNNNTLLLSAVTVLGFSLGVIIAILGLKWRKSHENLDTILLDQEDTIRHV